MDKKIVCSIIGNLLNIDDIDVIEKEGHVIFFSPSRKVILDYSTTLFGRTITREPIDQKNIAINGWLYKGCILYPQKNDPELALKIRKMVNI